MFKPLTAYVSLLLLALFLLSGCKSGGRFRVEDFDPLSNYSNKLNDSVYTIQADLTNAVLYGIEIPTHNQSKNGKFSFSFKLKNETGKAKRYYYKIYYQNESYKWKEGDSLDHENFYGSWEEAALGFKATELVENEAVVIDSFKILGNPRDEKIYYGTDPELIRITDTALAYFTKRLKSEPEWYQSAKEKAVFNKVSEEEQIYFECVWAINNRFENDSYYNNRWKRNPRMGNYKFMLVVCEAEDLIMIPEEVKTISKPMDNGKFHNPFAYFSGEGKKLKHSKTLVAKKQLYVQSNLDPGSGIYIDRFKINKTGLGTACYNSSCGESEQLRKRAQFSQYFHHINKNWEFVNVKEARDVVSEQMTREDYQKLISDYSKSKNFVHAFSNITDCPCKTVVSDSASKSLSIINPGNAPGQYKKELVGIMSRIGFTYGKWTAKIQFPKLISEDNVWNGITAAYWLIFQSDAKWNMRRSCNAEIGYIPKHAPDNPESVKEAKPLTTYSEIDFEIVKDSKFWTKSSYGNKENYPKEDASLNNDITICCTNWDMACHQPKNFIFGAKKVNVEGKTNEYNRWDFFNKLLTSKIPVPHKEAFDGEYYYYEIDWQPERIVWRIGKDKNNLKEICRMNYEMTSIPNNQMIMVMSQEFHYQEWWPTAPFLQNFIPFPKNDIVGKLLEVEIH
jgi:hypothetical protein